MIKCFIHKKNLQYASNHKKGWQLDGLKCFKNSKTVLKIEIWPIVRDLWGSRIYLMWGKFLLGHTKHNAHLNEKVQLPADGVCNEPAKSPHEEGGHYDPSTAQGVRQNVEKHSLERG